MFCWPVGKECHQQNHQQPLIHTKSSLQNNGRERKIGQEQPKRREWEWRLKKPRVPVMLVWQTMPPPLSLSWKQLSVCSTEGHEIHFIKRMISVYFLHDMIYQFQSTTQQMQSNLQVTVTTHHGESVQLIDYQYWMNCHRHMEWRRFYYL